MFLTREPNVPEKGRGIFQLSEHAEHCSCCLHVRHLLQPERFDCLLAQYKLLHLATGRQGIGLHKLEVARNLLMADLPFAIAAQLLLSKLLACFG
jgi:hypothetical protein